jgi:hypothetical protein
MKQYNRTREEARRVKQMAKVPQHEKDRIAKCDQLHAQRAKAFLLKAIK